ncbi:LysE family translocator [Thioclava sp. BHET1]|nr:LysE family translocator [Thioclava sp. BHET1]
MNPEVWISYVAIYAAISLMPGPSVVMVSLTALRHGRRAAVLCVLGDVLGGVVIMVLAYFGLGAILATSAVAYGVLKWGGIAYLAVLGLLQLREAARGSVAPATEHPTSRTGLRAGFLTGVLNPKAILFYMAFFAQFIDASSPALPQFLILALSSSMVVALVLSGYAFLAARLAGALRAPRALRWISLGSGTALLGTSAWMAATR